MNDSAKRAIERLRTYQAPQEGFPVVRRAAVLIVLFPSQLHWHSYSVEHAFTLKPISSRSLRRVKGSTLGELPTRDFSKPLLTGRADQTNFFALLWWRRLLTLAGLLSGLKLQLIMFRSGRANGSRRRVPGGNSQARGLRRGRLVKR